MSGMRSQLRSALLLGALALCSVACRVSDGDIQAWKATAKGPGKLVAVLQAEKYPFELRTQAAVALIEMERGDVDGAAELQKALRHLDEKTRQQLVENMVPHLERLMNTADPKAVDASGQPVELSPLQIRAKDAAYLLLSQGDAATRKRLTDAVVAWYAVDFNARSLAGNYSAEQVIRSLGAPGAVKLVDGLNEKLPSPTLIKSSELISQIGDDATKARAAQRLVEIERTMESPAYLDWLKEQIRTQLKGTGVGADGKPVKVDENRVKSGATITRTNFIAQGALPAMKFFGDQPVVLHRLLEIAEQRGDAPELTEKRRIALLALQGRAGKSELKRLQALALDAKAPLEVRDEAFDRLAEIGSPEIIPSLWPLVQSAKEERLRWRAGELVLTVGGKEVVTEFLNRLPAEKDIKYPSGELTGYATRLSQMTQSPVGLIRERLASPKWWEKVIAIKFFGRKGTEADAALIQPLTTDTTAVQGEGWPKDTTVGAVAKETVEALHASSAKPAGSGN